MASTYIDLDSLNTELLPFLYIVSDYSISSLNSKNKYYNREFAHKVFWNWINPIAPCEEIFEQRIRLYGELINGKTPHFDWLISTKPTNWNGIMRCCAAVGDILFNPNRAVDYDNAPTYLQGFQNSIDFSVKMQDFIKSIVEFHNKIYKFFERLK